MKIDQTFRCNSWKNADVRLTFYPSFYQSLLNPTYFYVEIDALKCFLSSWFEIFGQSKYWQLGLKWACFSLREYR